MATNESVVLTAKDRFYDEKYAEGIKSLKEIEKLWLASGLARKKGDSAKPIIGDAWLRGEVTLDNLEEWLKENGTANDVSQISYYRTRVKDYEKIAKAYGGKRKEA